MSRMRKQFIETSLKIMSENNQAVFLLGDIGVFGFREAFEKYSDRIYNIGILEQSTVSMAAGLSKAGLIPTIHTIAPFMIERALEQIKIDFGYQKLRGNFISVGGSYDYAALGCTHHCPADIPILKAIPDTEIIIPGTREEFDVLFRSVHSNNSASYIRLSERENSQSHPVEFGRATVIKKGKHATVVAIGTMLEPAVEAVRGLDVTLLYYTTVHPFDAETLAQNCGSSKVLLIEPSMVGGLAFDALQSLSGRAIQLECMGVPREFLRNYGTRDEHDIALGLTSKEIHQRILKLMGDDYYSVDLETDAELRLS